MHFRFNGTLRRLSWLHPHRAFWGGGGEDGGGAYGSCLPAGSVLFWLRLTGGADSALSSCCAGMGLDFAGRAEDASGFDPGPADSGFAGMAAGFSSAAIAAGGALPLF